VIELEQGCHALYCDSTPYFVPSPR